MASRRAVLAIAAVLGVALGTPPASADTVAYLVNVTVRPGYDFANADAALSYGYGVCDRVRAGLGYPVLVDTVLRDFSSADLSSTDDYQAIYLINQAVNELCPQLIWQLRQSAAHYTGTRG